MHAYKLQINIEEDHRISMQLPEDFPAGPAEVIVLANAASTREPLRLGGILGTQHVPAVGDPIAETLQELREERTDALDRRTERYF